MINVVAAILVVVAVVSMCAVVWLLWRVVTGTILLEITPESRLGPLADAKSEDAVASQLADVMAEVVMELPRSVTSARQEINALTALAGAALVAAQKAYARRPNPPGTPTPWESLEEGLATQHFVATYAATSSSGPEEHPQMGGAQ